MYLSKEYLNSADSYNEYLKIHITNVNRAYQWMNDTGILSDIFDDDAIIKASELVKVHDASKYDEPEYEAYRQYFNPMPNEIVSFNDAYKNREGKGDRAKFNIGWLHHEHNNPHHWEYWVQLDEDHPGQVISTEMLDEYIIEMLCDWLSFSITKNDPNDIYTWYDSHKDSILIHDNVRNKVELVLNKLRPLIDQGITAPKLSESVVYTYDFDLDKVPFSEDESHELNPKLWDGNLLKNEVSQKINEIVGEFILELQDSDIPISVIDTWIVGSNASYNYTDNSDLDVHIIANLNSVSCDVKTLQLLYNYFKSYFNDKYDIKIKGIPVELYIEDVNSSIYSNGIYSLEKNDWIKFPVYNEIPEVDISLPLKSVIDEFDAIMMGTSPQSASDLIDHMYMMRKIGLMTDGEYSVGNLVFKEFRNQGYLDKLKDKMSQDVSKELSLESMKNSKEFSKMDSKLTEGKMKELSMDLDEYRRLENELKLASDNPDIVAELKSEMDEIRNRIPDFDYWYNQVNNKECMESLNNEARDFIYNACKEAYDNGKLDIGLLANIYEDLNDLEIPYEESDVYDYFVKLLNDRSFNDVVDESKLTEADKVSYSELVDNAKKIQKTESVRRHRPDVMEGSNASDILDKAYNGSYYTIIGAGGDIEEWKNGYQELLDKEGIGKVSEWIQFSGKDVNDKYDLINDNKFSNKLTFLVFPLTGLDASKLAMFRLRMDDKWFDDLVDNSVSLSNLDKYDEED